MGRDDALEQRSLWQYACLEIAPQGQARLPRMYDCAYTEVRMVEWDPEKAAANRRKHGVDFGDAVTALSDEMALTTPEDTEEEDRSVTLGMDALGRLLVVVYTWRGDEVRVISARRATPAERREYEAKR